MNHVERFRALMAFEPVDRLPLVEWADYWNLTVDRWLQEGVPEDLENAYAMREWFGLDPYRQFWLRPRHWRMPHSGQYGQGVVDTEDDYERVRPWLYRREVVNPTAIAPWGEKHARGECVVWLSIDGFFWHPRTLFGIERHMYAFYDRADLMARINEETCQYYAWLIDEFCRYCTPDFMTFAEDMSYNHGPMLSESLFDKFVAPYYRRLTDRLHEHGVRCIVDSDGDVTQMVPWLLRSGIDGVLPLEHQAGVDVVQLRRDHPEARIVGAFDKMVMKQGEEAMRAEFDRLLPVMRQGGYIPSVDHQTPPDCSLANYRVYLRLLEEYCHKAAN